MSGWKGRQENSINMHWEFRMLSALFAILLDILETAMFLSDTDNLEGTCIFVGLQSDSVFLLWRNISKLSCKSFQRISSFPPARCLGSKAV